MKTTKTRTPRRAQAGPLKTAKPRDQKRASSPFRTKEWNRLFDHLERAAKALEQETDEEALIPEPAAIVRASRRLKPHLDGQALHVNQQIARNVIRIVAEKANPDVVKQTMRVFESALVATEDYAVRAAYLIGAARGIAWRGELDKR